MELSYAKRMSVVKASDIRDLLKVTEQTDTISFAGGFPANELFPIKEIERITGEVLERFGGRALNYASTEGYPPLRQWIAERMNNKFGTSLDADNILLTHGSQQGLDLAGKLFIDEGDVVICESPTYLAALGAFRAYGCRFREIPTDHDGMIIAELERALIEEPKAKFIYIIPEFQNPTGRSWSVERRKCLAELAERYGVAVIEDNPYGELRFEGEERPIVKSFDKCGNVIYAGSFSKIFCPGFRIAWLAGRKDIIRKFTLLKQSTDLQCSTIAPIIIHEFMLQNDIEAHIRRIVEVYRHRRDVATECIRRYFPKDITYTQPEGGLFIWIMFPEGFNTRDILPRCLERGVAFVPGGAFFPNTTCERAMRINFSNMPDDKLRKGLKIIGEVIAERAFYRF